MKPSARPASSRSGALPPKDGVVRLFRDRGGLNGKTGPVIRVRPVRAPALVARVAFMMRLCGAGGTLKDDAVEIQGDHRERLAEHLRAAGFTVKLAGG